MKKFRIPDETQGNFVVKAYALLFVIASIICWPLIWLRERRREREFYRNHPDRYS